VTRPGEPAASPSAWRSPGTRAPAGAGPDRRPQGGRRRTGPHRTARQFAGPATARLGADGWCLPLWSGSRSPGQVADAGARARWASPCVGWCRQSPAGATMIVTGRAARGEGCGMLVGVEEGQADGQFVALR